ncbi:MAG: DUF2914 domain-containing protein [Candidatus Pacebacteria bacterium]|nr:DUF2914 domain-containing protein [Candidatus Paceibacterota bacterium]
MFKRTITFIRKHRQHLPTVAIFSGFIWDSLTLGRPDQLYSNLVMLAYLFIAGSCIIFMAQREETGAPQSLWAQTLTQFSFGNLASGLLVLYMGSATLIGNWPFLLILLALLIGNEFVKNRHQRIRFSVAVYYLLILAYLIVLIPVLTRTVASWTFLVSAFASLVVVVGYLAIIRKIARRVYDEDRRLLVRSVLAIVVTFSFLYYANLIPPVPLSAREVGIYHSVTRTELGYEVMYEKHWYEFWKNSDSTIHAKTPVAVGCFSSVFAPADITIPIQHVWDEYNPRAREWEVREVFDFPVAGGREEGYRGYSIKRVEVGKWRCSVETNRGALLGRAAVNVEYSEDKYPLVVESR